MIGINPTVLVMKYLNSQVSRDAIQAVGDYLNSKESYSQRFKIKKTHNDLKKNSLLSSPARRYSKPCIWIGPLMEACR